MFLITAKNLGYLVIPGDNMLDALRTFHLWFGNEPVVSIQPAP